MSPHTAELASGAGAPSTLHGRPGQPRTTHAGTWALSGLLQGRGPAPWLCSSRHRQAVDRCTARMSFWCRSSSVRSRCMDKWMSRS